MKNAVIRCVGPASLSGYVRTVRQDRTDFGIASTHHFARRFTVEKAREIAAALPERARTCFAFEVEPAPPVPARLL